MRDKILGGLIGHAVGDALGVAAEFHSREDLRKNPIKDMRPVMTFHNTPIEFQPAGTWSDDTSMSLAFAESLIVKGAYDADDAMRRFSEWYNGGEYTPFGEMWDCGSTSSTAIYRFDNGEPVDNCGGRSEDDNGNGSIMRILPLAFYLRSRYGDYPQREEAFELIHLVSSLTHAHERSKMACGIYLSIAAALLNESEAAPAVYKGLHNAKTYYMRNKDFRGELKHFDRLYESGFADLPESGIRSGGYVIDTLEASVWCLLNTSNYADCVLKAVNLGDDADTTAAVAGGLAGAFYGIAAIPRKWVDSLQRKEYVLELYEKFADFTLRTV